MKWKKCKLGEILNFRRGHDLPHSKMKRGAVPVAGSNGIIGYHDTSTPVTPILTIGRSGNVGKPYIYDFAWAHNTTLYVDDFKGNDPIFLYYLCLTLPFAHFGGGSAVPTLNRNHIHPLEVNYPPNIEDQRLIASILSSFDSKIECNRKICANLEAQAQALFKSWFVDFAPFKDGKFVESELGMIPEGWRVGKLSDYVDNLGGYSYKGSELQTSSIAMATIKNFVRGGGFKTDGFKEIVISKKIKDYQYVNLFDVLVAHTDLTQNAEVVGNAAIILNTAGYKKLIMSMDLTKVVAKDKRITSPLLHSLLNTKSFKNHALGYVNGTTVLHMSKKAVPEYKLAMPENLDILNELTSILNNLYCLMSETYDENLRLSALRDTLLPKLMSGQLEI